jgi:hypothetical protein
MHVAIPERESMIVSPLRSKFKLGTVKTERSLSIQRYTSLSTTANQCLGTTRISTTSKTAAKTATSHMYPQSDARRKGDTVPACLIWGHNRGGGRVFLIKLEGLPYWQAAKEAKDLPLIIQNRGSRVSPMISA